MGKLERVEYETGSSILDQLQRSDGRHMGSSKEGDAGVGM